MNPDESKLQLITLREAARDYPIPVATWRYWIHLKKVPSYRVGRRRFLKRADIHRLLEAGREEAQ